MKRTRFHTYLTSLVFAYALIGTLASFQILFVYKDVSAKLFVVPFVAATLMGLLLGTIRWLRINLQHQTELFQAVADFAQEFTYIRTPEGNYSYISPACKEVTGYEADEFYTNPQMISDLVDPGEKVLWENHVHPINQDGRPEPIDFRIRHADGSTRVIRHLCEKLHGSDEQFLGTRSTNIDVTNTIETERHIAHMAEYDPLTSLGNRRRLNRILTEMTSEERPETQSAAILYIDLDRFKYINDVYGHSIGDVLLVRISAKMSELISGNESTELFRFGGDEFVLILPNFSCREELEHFCGQLLHELGKPIAVGDIDFTVGASIGISCYPDDGHDPDTLIKHSDLAMYESKREHKGYHFFDPRMAHVAADLMSYEAMLRESLDKDELEAWFQPIIDVQSNEVVGAEALARWIHGTHGLIGPNRFITMAEDTGLIVPLGMKILTQGVRELAAWREMDINMRMSFNVSPRQFQQRDFVEQVLEEIRRVDVPVGSVVVEITESVLMENLDEVGDKLAALRDVGLLIALDDFGSGFSSFKYLADLPVDIMKIDRTLLLGIEQNQRRLHMIRSLVYLAQDLGLDVVAEGVEDLEMAELLRGMGPVLVQGYHYSKPLPARDFNRFLRERMGAVDLDHG